MVCLEQIGAGSSNGRIIELVEHRLVRKTVWKTLHLEAAQGMGDHRN